MGVIGAAGSRLRSAEVIASVQAEHAAAARSRIVDADVAEAAAELVRSKILRDASAAILAQSNQQPALSLALLTGVGGFEPG